MKRTISRDVLTLEEAADYLRLPPETIAREAAQGHIPGRRIEDAWRFLRAAIDEWLRSQDSRLLLLQQADALAGGRRPSSPGYGPLTNRSRKIMH